MTAAGTALDGLKRRQPEWAPWLAVVEEVLRETANPRWEAAVPSGARPQRASIPLLAGATFRVEGRSIRRLLERLIRIASRSGTPKMATLGPVPHADLDVVSLFRASLCQESERITAIAAVPGADAEALQAVIGLVPLPFLHACSRRWASFTSESWVEGYCPVCGSWPAFAEVRGIERSRHFRCGRCGGEWHSRLLNCPYCALSDHDGFASLVPEHGGSHAVIDACQRCHGYVKTFTRLQGCPPAAVMLDDFATVDLDVAAVQQGYTRPPGAGYALDVTVVDDGAMRGLFAWNT